MKLSVSQKIKFRVSRQIILAGTVLGLIYIVFANGFQNFYPFVNGAVVGFLLGMAISFLELWVFTSGVRKLHFATVLTLRTIIYLVLCILIIFNVVLASRTIMFDMTYMEVLVSEEFKTYIFEGNFPIAVIYSLAFAFSINFTRMINRKIGQGVLISHILGTYYTPVIQARIVMFLNINNSKKISQKLGPFTFHQFLNEFFFDITTTIVKRQGIIYEYIEDLVVITWSIEKGRRDANCIRVFFEINEALATSKEKYYKKYGFMPKIKTGLHTGELVRAEIGDVKTQIVFHGDVMNTSSRVLGKTNELNAPLLATKDLLDIIDLPLLYDSQSVGRIKLKGKGNEVELFRIWDKELTQI